MNATVGEGQPTLEKIETGALAGTTEAAAAAQKAIDEGTNESEMPDEEYVPPTRVMEFVGVAVETLARGLFNTVRVGRKWADDLQVGEVVELTCTASPKGEVLGRLYGTVVHVGTGEVQDLIRGHSATNFSVRDEGNPGTRELALGMELRGHYNLGPHVVTMGGTVVYFMPSSDDDGYDEEVVAAGHEGDDLPTSEQAGKD